jgi:hypothetical protein
MADNRALPALVHDAPRRVVLPLVWYLYPDVAEAAVREVKPKETKPAVCHPTASSSSVGMQQDCTRYVDPSFKTAGWLLLSFLVSSTRQKCSVCGRTLA